MLDDLNRFGLPAKYAIVGAVACFAGWLLCLVLGIEIAAGWLSLTLAGAVGGFIGGTIRKSRGKAD